MLNEHVPEKMTIAAFRDHPIGRMLRFAGGYGRKGLPSRSELDALGLAARDRKALEIALRDVSELRDDASHNPGENSARVEAERRAGEIVGGLPDEQRDPAWFTRETEDLTQLGPAELASRVTSRAGGWA